MCERKRFRKSKEFLSKIPHWEKQYKGSNDLQVKYSSEDWIKADAIFTVNRLEILGETVMEDWETPYMRELAAIATANGGTVLEIGFGMGISGRFIQEREIKKHIIH